MSVRVAFDARMTSHMSAGMRAYTAALLDRLPAAAPDLAVTPFGTGDNFDAAEQVGMPRWIMNHRPDLVHYPTPFAPLINPRPYVLTIHDLIELRFPHLSKPKASLYYRQVTGRIARGAARVICDDERTAGELAAALGVRPERVRVVPLGVGEAFLRAPERGPAGRRYLFYAGNRRAHKDLPTLFRAWSELPPDCAIDLHLTGRDDLGSALDPYRRADARIVFAGELDTAGLIAAYRGALALVHPSLAEGFGLTLLEASVLGVPVVAAETSVPRILAAIASPFPPGDSGALRALLERLIREPEPFEAKARAGAAEARGFTWDRCAAATAAVYREAIVPR